VRILLSAYLDHNLGDDLFVDYFVQQYPQHEIHLLCDDASMRLNSQLESHRSLRKTELRPAVKAVLEFDALVIIGGSIFQENPAFYKYDYRRNLLVTIFRLAGRKVFIIGSNIGPVRTRRGRRIFKYCFTLANAVSVRDSASIDLLREWKCRPNYLLAPDLVFSYPYAPPPDARTAGRLGISVINRGARAIGAQRYVETLAAVSEAYLRAHPEHQVWLFGFDGGQEDDGATVGHIAELLASYRSRVFSCVYATEPPIRQFLDAFSSCDYLICSRFHSVVLAMKLGIPFLPIDYSGKTLNMLRDLGYRGTVGSYASMENLNVDSLLQDILHKRSHFQLDERQVTASRQHFAATDRALSAG
jgi:colanic acid/amylovoran biosynthesis protein